MWTTFSLPLTNFDSYLQNEMYFDLIAKSAKKQFVLCDEILAHGATTVFFSRQTARLL